MSSLQERFDDKYEAVTESGCWIWTGGITTAGYGMLWDSAAKKTKYAHRISINLNGEDIPPGKLVCHKCDIPACVNPDHLFTGTQKDNINDMMAKGRNGGQFGKGENHKFSKLNDANIVSIRNDKRIYKEIALHYKIDDSTVSDIKNRKLWSHIN